MPTGGNAPLRGSEPWWRQKYQAPRRRVRVCGGIRKEKEVVFCLNTEEKVMENGAGETAIQTGETQQCHSPMPHGGECSARGGKVERCLAPACVMEVGPSRRCKHEGMSRWGGGARAVREKARSQNSEKVPAFRTVLAGRKW